MKYFLDLIGGECEGLRLHINNKLCRDLVTEYRLIVLNIK